MLMLSLMGRKEGEGRMEDEGRKEGRKDDECKKEGGKMKEGRKEERRGGKGQCARADPRHNFGRN
jgi:hypothetical protein